MAVTMPEHYEDPYAVLDLARAATDEEIKQAYFAGVRQHPPEREPQAFKRIRAAYDRLRDPEKRVEADMRLLEVWPATARARRLPRLDLTIRPEHLLAILEVDSDLGRTDLRADYREVHL